MLPPTHIAAFEPALITGKLLIVIKTEDVAEHPVVLLVSVIV
jgi:hypothetical protein